jgi:superfamily II DNA or RNA helicase/intein/homing endonuclease
MNIKLRPYQQECIDTILKQHPGNYLVQLATGLGKCFCKDTEILMYDGTIKKVQDIKVNDILMGWDNKPRKVISLARGKEQMYEVKQNKKKSYTVNESHILSLKCTGIGNNTKKYVYDINGKKYTNNDICNIKVNDYIKCSKTFKHVMKGFSSKIDWEHNEPKIEPYFLGLWLGDGNNKSLSICTPDIEIVNYLNYFSEKNNLNIRIENQKNNKSKMYHLTSNYKRIILRKYFKENLFNNKHIPKNYKINSRKVRLELLAGLLDSDGYLHKDNTTFEFTTKYKHIACDVAFIARSLGFSCSELLKYVKKYNKNYYRLNISGLTKEIPTKIKRKQAINKPNKKNLMTGIKVIKKDIDNYYGFEIEGNDRMFLLYDFTVVHNTVIFSQLINHIEGRMLILSHRQELVYQPKKYFTCSYGIELGKETSNGERVISASVQSLVNRLDNFKNDDFEIIVVDECFPKGTLIDNVPIEKIKCGDIITSYNHKTNTIEKKEVINTFKSKPKNIVVVKLSNGKEIICTGGHPFYTKEGYKQAAKLNNNDEVYYMWEKCYKKIKKKTQICILLKRMFRKKIKLLYGKNKQKICIRKNETKQSNVKKRSKRKSIKEIKRNRTLPKNKMWKWNRSNSYTTKNVNCFKRFLSIFRISNTNENKKRKWISNLLQNRHSNTNKNDSNRNRWKQSLCFRKTKARQKERVVFEWIRVENIKIQKRTSDGKFGGLCPNSYVYNIEVKDNNNYFVDKILVHNCHHSSAKTYKKIIEYFNPRLLLGFTATPNRNDKVGLSDIFDDIIFEKDLKWGIQNKYLSGIECKRVNIKYDLRGIRQHSKDFTLESLDKKVNIEEANEQIKEAYEKYARGQTLIFATTVDHAENIAEKIDGAVVISAETKNRQDIIDKFTNREIPVIVNCMIFTEGTNIPLIETIIMARPTKNKSLYCIDYDTEILTDNGWKNHKTINIENDKTATFDIKTKEIKYKNIKGYINRKINIGENYVGIKSNYIDIRVTNKHRMIYCTRRKKELRITKAENLTKMKDGFFVPVSGYYNYNGINLYDHEIKFIAWTMTDGNINKHNNAINITQSKKNINFVNEIEECINECGMKYNKILKKDSTNFSKYREHYIFTISKGKPRGRDKNLRGWEYLSKYFYTDKLWDMSNRQFEIFLKTCNKADGNKYIPKNWVKRSIDITKGKKEFIEKLQIACITRGYKANVRTFKSNYGTEVYTIHIKKQEIKHLSSHYDKRPKFEIENYKNENCWCIENDIGTIITRRNGKVTIMGQCQMIGRGLRLSPGKEKLLLLDCVGVSNLNMCTAPSLIGLDMQNVDQDKENEIEGDLFDLENKIIAASDTPECWIKNVKIVDLWAKEMEYNTHDINFFKMPNGSMRLSIPSQTFEIPAPDELGYTRTKHGTKVKMQKAIDWLFLYLQKNHMNEKALWNLSSIKRWGQAPATEKQLKLIKRKFKKFKGMDNLNKLEACCILNRVMVK